MRFTRERLPEVGEDDANAWEQQLKEFVARLVQTAAYRSTDSVLAAKAIQLLEELLGRRFPKLSREEIRAMFELEDLRKTRV